MPRVLLRKKMKLRIRQGQKAEVTIPKVLIDHLDSLQDPPVVRGDFLIYYDADEEGSPRTLQLNIKF